MIFLGLTWLGCASSPPPRDVVAGERLLAQAETLERQGRFAEAAVAYEHISAVERSSVGRDPARGLVRAAALFSDRLSDPDRALADLWRAIDEYPDTAAADDALRALIRLRPPALRQRLLEAARALPHTEIADNLLFEAAALAEPDAPLEARAGYEAVARDYPKGALRDTALWRAASLARASHDTEGALADLRAITSRRRDSFLVGTFNTTRLDDAQLETGKIYLEDKHDLARAVSAFELLRDDMLDSVLRDDAQLWIARAYAQGGDRVRACDALARLRKQFPESTLLRRQAPELAQTLGCAP